MAGHNPSRSLAAPHTNTHAVSVVRQAPIGIEKWPGTASRRALVTDARCRPDQAVHVMSGLLSLDDAE